EFIADPKLAEVGRPPRSSRKISAHWRPPVGADRGRFPLVRRGYDQTAVDGQLERLENSIVMLTADRDAAAEQAALLVQRLSTTRAEVERLSAQLSRLSEPPENVENMSERIQWMLKLAKDEAAEIRRKAAMDATDLVAQAEEARARNEVLRGEIEAQRNEI